MTIQAVAWVLEHEATTTGTARLVLLSLANHANEQGEAWPSVATIQREANVALPRTVQGALRELEDAGLVTTHRQAAPDHRIRPDRRPNLYRLVGFLAWLSTGTPPHGGARQGPPRPNGGPSQAERGSLRGRHGGPSEGPQTISEPSGTMRGATRYPQSSRPADDPRPRVPAFTPDADPVDPERVAKVRELRHALEPVDGANMDAVR